MKKTVLIIFVLFLSLEKSSAQKAGLNIAATGFKGTVDVFDPGVNFDPQKFISVIQINKNGDGAYITILDKPKYIVVYFNLPNYVCYQYVLYLSPGDELAFKINFKTNKPAVAVTGKGSIYNQPRLFAFTDLDLTGFKKDKTPQRIISAIKAQEAANGAYLQLYIKQYKPSQAFAKNTQMNNRYFALSVYYEFFHRQFPPFLNNPDRVKWQSVLDSLMAKHKLNNDAALGAYNYDHLIALFLINEPPGLLQTEKEDPTAFYKEWYGTTVKNGKKIFTDEGRSLFIERMIDRNFKGKAREMAYADMLRFFLMIKHDEGLEVVYEHFEHKYPSSAFVPLFRNAIVEIIARKKQALSSKMVFVANNGTALNTLEDVKRLMKGKTVFVDMWGTWCGPCRVELEKFASQLRDHFKDKNVTFLYIANKDTGHEAEWKKAISYFQIEGTHILANSALEKDIMARLKSGAYPTYFIITKNGAIKKAQDISNMSAVIKELEGVL